MVRFLYRLAWAGGRPLAGLLVRGDGKAARTVRGRHGGARALAAWAATHRRPGARLVWFHAASVGEGRQAEAVLLRLRQARPDWLFLYTYASASAESFAGRLPVDFAGYVPADTPADVGSSLDAVRPDALVFSATDLWPVLVEEARRRGVRLALISATLAPTSSRRGWWARALLTPAYAALDSVGAIDAADAAGLAELGVRREAIALTGDTRHDSAAARAAAADRASPALRAFAADGPPIVVCGSTWPADEEVLLPALAEARRHAPVRVVVAPHEVGAAHLQALERGLGAAVRLSALEDAARRGEPVPPWEHCIVDRVGILADLYASAAVAYVGGGFGASGLHAVIEPAAHGVPVLFGPRWQSSRDARLLLEAGGACAADGADDLRAALRAWLENDTARAAAGAAARAVVDHGLGAAGRSAQLVLELIERRPA